MMAMAALACGLVMALGLSISSMVDPAKVLAFLDVFGNFDPTLAFVMAGALLVTTIGYRLCRCRARPVLCGGFDEPKNIRIDRRLLLGSALFGIGWGLAGFCPAPALVAIGLGVDGIFMFVLPMAAGMLAGRIIMGPSGKENVLNTRKNER